MTTDGDSDGDGAEPRLSNKTTYEDMTVEIRPCPFACSGIS